MFPTRQRMLLLQVGGNLLRTTPDHPFFVPGRGWITAAALRVGDRVQTADGQDVLIEAIRTTDEPALVYQVDVPVPPPFLHTGGWPVGTLIATADGPKPIEDIKPGDRLLVRPLFDPDWN